MAHALDLKMLVGFEGPVARRYPLVRESPGALPVPVSFRCGCAAIVSADRDLVGLEALLQYWA